MRLLSIAIALCSLSLFAQEFYLNSAYGDVYLYPGEIHLRSGEVVKPQKGILMHKKVYFYHGPEEQLSKVPIEKIKSIAPKRLGDGKVCKGKKRHYCYYVLTMKNGKEFHVKARSGAFVSKGGQNAAWPNALDVDPITDESSVLKYKPQSFKKVVFY